jgi:hypothetical protein
MKALSILALAICTVALQTMTAFAQSTSDQAIRAVLETQVQAWNAGNITEFMKGYWHSDSLRFASGGSIQRGWKSTLERYQKSYPDKAAMGVLTFSNLEITLFNDNAAVVFGAWKLQRQKDAPGGLFTLTFRKFPVGKSFTTTLRREIDIGTWIYATITNILSPKSLISKNYAPTPTTLCNHLPVHHQCRINTCAAATSFDCGGATAIARRSCSRCGARQFCGRTWNNLVFTRRDGRSGGV